MNGNTLRAALFGLLCSLAGGLLHADDTEIYFGAAQGGDQVIRPNVLFIMDTSGSMGTQVSGTGLSRLENMKEALNLILDGVSNINVGLMRFHSRTQSNAVEGGPILFPVANVDGDACDYEDCAASTPSASAQVASSADDAEQHSDGSVTLSSTTLELTRDDALLQPPTGTVEVTGAAQTDDSENSSWSDKTASTGNNYLRLGDQLATARFPAVTVPRNATIVSAQLVFTSAAWGSAATAPIKIQLADDAAAITTSNYDIQNRTWSGTAVSWTVPATAQYSAVTSPDVTSLVQQVVNRTGWTSGNAMAFRFDDNGGQQYVYAYKGAGSSTARRPLLRITYQLASSGLTDATQRVGLRFLDVGVPQGATVTSARLEFTAAAATSEATNLTVQAQASDDAPVFTAATNDLSSRTTTAASANWSGMEAWNTAGVNYQSVDLTSVVQEVVSRSGWCGGNAMAFMLSGTGQRIAHSFDGAPDMAPTLQVTYDTSAITAGHGCMKQTTVKTIATGNDDAEESATTHGMRLNDTSLDLTYYSSQSQQQLIGLRFRELPIPPAATVLAAQLDFVGTSGSGAESLKISGEAADDPGTFTSTSGDIGNRTKTTAGVTWTDPTAVATSGDVIATPGLATIVQELVNRSGWRSGNDMVFIIENLSGTNYRRVKSYNSDPAGAPKLTVRYQFNLGDVTGPAVTVRQRLKNQVDGLTAGGYTPIVDSLFEAARYYRGDEVYFGKTRGAGPTYDGEDMTGAETTRLSHPASYTGGTVSYPGGCTDANLNAAACKTQTLQGTPIYKSPITQSCQANYVVFLTDGEPTANHSVTPIQTMIGSTCAGSGYGKCADELAYFLGHQDQRADMNDSQRVTTYTIGFNLDGDPQFLRDMATAGGGAFYAATDAASLVSVFQSILAQILEQNTTYTAPAVSVNAFNRLTHRNELYFALFRPSGDAKWPGNVKRYQLASGDNPVILDQNGIEAVDPTTGYFTTSSTSYWTAAADAPDGDDVAMGGAASRLTTSRTVYTYTDAAAPSAVDLTLPAHALTEGNTELTKALLDIADKDDAYRTSLIQWARGIDVLDSNGDGSSTDARREMGDPLHSKPALVTYGGTDANPDITLYSTTNEGYLHAIDTSDGHEIFSFVPRELLPHLDAFYTNSAVGGHPYGLDGPITAWSSDSHVYIYAGMRRGGRNYYALDVTNRSHPILKWMISGGSGNFTELGQSWSQMVPAKVKLNGAVRNVMVFGGGYDTAQDNQSTPADDTVGRAIYMVDAVSGERLWWAGATVGANLVLSELKNGVPGNVRVVDWNGDGISDMLYFGDMRGQVWRIDLNPNNTGAGNLATGGRLAALGGDTAADHRRFYYAPDAALAEKDGERFLAISVGSGYRAHPLNTTIHDRFYMIKDSHYTTPIDWTAFTTPYAETDLYDATADVIGTGADAARQAALSDLAGKHGWLIHLRKGDGSYEGEKVLAEATTFDNKVIFTTFKPTRAVTDSCSADVGTATAYIVSLFDATAVQDFNHDGDVTTDDRTIKLKRGGIPPEAVVLLPPPEGEPPVVLVGPEQLGVTLTNPVVKRYWINVQ